MNFDDELNSWLDSVEQTVNLSVEDEAKITKAGADVFADALEKEIKANHYNHNRKTGDNPHLADSVLVNNKNIDNIKDGKSTVGFTSQKAYIARFLNNGFTTKDGKFVNGDFFIEKTRKQIQKEILNAQIEQYKKMIR